MTLPLWRSALAGLAAFAVPVTASAQAASCPSPVSKPADTGELTPDAAQMRCDIERAASLRARAAALYGPGFASRVEIIDTASPSGAAYVYDLVTEEDTFRLEARSVPQAEGPLCRLTEWLAPDTAQAIRRLLTETSAETLPDYGPREEVTLNRDGSRSSRLVINSHDIFTRVATREGMRSFSRHAGSDDPVNRLNRFVIGIANLSSGWTCSAS